MRKSGISTVLTNILWSCLFERTLKSNDASSFWPPKIAINESLCANIHDSFGINHRVSCEKNMARIPLVDGNIWHPGETLRSPIPFLDDPAPWKLFFQVACEQARACGETTLHQLQTSGGGRKESVGPRPFHCIFGANELVYPRYMGYTWRRNSHLLNG